MQTLDGGVEIRIADADVDRLGQLIDLETTLHPFAPAVRALDEQLIEALTDDQLGGETTT
jgi:hypothetical protein